MKNLFILFGFTIISFSSYSQNYGATYKPITRPSLNQNQQQYEQEYRQPQVSYQRVTGVSKSGGQIPLRVRIVDGRIDGIEYYNTTFKNWTNCISFSRTSSYSMDDYERAYDYIVKPDYGSQTYYF